MAHFHRFAKTSFAIFVFGLCLFGGLLEASAQGVGGGNLNSDFSIIQSQQAESHFWNLHLRLKGFAVVVLLIMVVIAAVMATFQRTTMAIMVAVGGIILFGGYYVILLLYQGLN